MNNMLRDLVKKHFNLVDAPAVEEQVEAQVELSEEAVEEQIFGEIKTADGELTLTYEGEEFAVGTEIFVVTADGQVPAPDGEHELEGGIKIETEGGVIQSIERGEEDLPEIADETTAGDYPKEEMSEESTEETVEENFEEEVNETEQIIAAFAEIVKPMMETMQSDIDELKSKFNETEKKVETFASAPAAERTKAEIKSRNTAKTNVDYTPLNDDKKLQFERLLKIRNKK